MKFIFGFFKIFQIQTIYLIYQSTLANKVNLSSSLQNISENLNLVLENHTSYFLDQNVEFKKDITIIGQNNEIELIPTGDIKNFFSFGNGNQANLVNLTFIFGNTQEKQIISIILIDNASVIIFEGCTFQLFLRNQYFILVSNSNSFEFDHSSMESSVLINSTIIESKFINDFYLYEFTVRNTTFLDSLFFSSINFSSFILENIYFFENIFNNSNFMVNLDQMDIAEVFILNNLSLSNNLFLENSSFIDLNLFELNNNINFSNIQAQNNSFQNAFIQLTINSPITLNFSGIYLLQNSILGAILQITTYFNTESLPIYLDSIWVAYNNLETVAFLNYSQNFMALNGYFSVIITDNHFLNNLCFLGPCAYSFVSLVPSFTISIFSSNFSNNLAFYSDDSENPTCVLSVSGTLNIMMFNVIMNSNSIKKYDSHGAFSLGEMGNPCISTDASSSSLSIYESLFIRNAGYGSSSCINFIGNYLEVFNTSFDEFLGSKGEIYVFVVDSENVILGNVSFTNGNCGGIQFVSQREIIYFEGSNLTISKNSFYSNSFIFIEVQDYYMNFVNVNFVYNQGFQNYLFLALLNLGTVIETHVCNISNSHFLSNQLVTSGVLLVVTIGSITNITNSFFENNFGNSNSCGAAFYISGEITSQLIFINCFFFKNSAGIEAVGSIFLGTVILQDCLLTNNSVINLADAILNAEAYSLVILQNTTISYNSGGIFRASERVIFDIIGSIFKNNILVGDAVTFSISLLASGSITNCFFLNQSGVVDGHLLLLFNTLEAINFENNSIQNCSSFTGFLFQITAAQINITNLTIENCQASLFFLVSGIMQIDTLRIYNEKCSYEICFLKIMLSSTVQVQNLIGLEIYFENEEIISLTSSELYIINGSMQSIFSSANISIISVLSSIISFNGFTGEKINNTFLDSSKSTLLIINMYILGGTPNMFSAINSDNNNIMEVNNSFFIGFCNLEGGAIRSSLTLFNLKSSFFVSNSANNGGAIYTENSDISFEGNFFNLNNAKYGAAIYFQSKNLILDLSLFNNSFFNGTAIYGGGFYSVFNIPKSNNNTFSTNKASYGNNFASPPIALSLESNPLLNQILSNYQPSGIIEYNIVIRLMDVYNNIIRSDDLIGKATLALADENFYNYYQMVDESVGKKQLFGQVLSDFSNNSFIFTNVRINFKPNSSILLSIYTDLIEEFENGSFIYNFPHFLDQNQNYYFVLMINSTFCPIGFIFDPSNNECTQCPNGEYSLDQSDTYCHECPDNAECDVNGSYINVMPGYWRSDYFSTDILACIISDACLGNSCSEGYEGILCDTCITDNNNSYFKVPQSGCVQCKNGTLSYVIMCVVEN